MSEKVPLSCQRHFKGIENFYGLPVSTFLNTFLKTQFKNLGFRDLANVKPINGQLITEMQLVNQNSATLVSAPEPTSSSASTMAPVTTSSFPAGAAASQHHNCTPIHTYNFIIQFTDDTATVGQISDNDEMVYRLEVEAVPQSSGVGSYCPEPFAGRQWFKQGVVGV